MVYNIKEPIDIFFTAVEDPAEIDELTGRPYPPIQILDLEYIIVSKHRVFCDDSRAWICCPHYERICSNFKLTTYQ